MSTFPNPHLLPGAKIDTIHIPNVVTRHFSKPRDRIHNPAPSKQRLSDPTPCYQGEKMTQFISQTLLPRVGRLAELSNCEQNSNPSPVTYIIKVSAGHVGAIPFAPGPCGCCAALGACHGLAASLTAPRYGKDVCLHGMRGRFRSATKQGGSGLHSS